MHLDAATALSLTPKFRYVFQGAKGYPPILDRQDDLVPLEAMTLSGRGPSVDILPLDQGHGPIRSLGFRIGALAYCNDLDVMPEETLDALRGVEVFIVDALRYTPHPSHANLQQALEWAGKIGARRTVLTNLHIDMDYQTLLKELPEGVEPGYDLWSVELPL